MRGKTPENIFFTTNFPEVETIRINVLDAPEFSTINQFFQFENSRMVPEQMTDHKYASSFSCQIDQSPALVDGQTERFFDKHILAGKQRLPHHDPVGFRWSGNCNCMNGFVS